MSADRTRRSWGVWGWIRAHVRSLTAVSAVAAVLLAGAVFLRGSPVDPALTAVVRRQTIQIKVMESGILRPARSVTYRSPIEGRETEVTFLAPEGTSVQEGDLIATLDTTELQRELERARQALRQTDADVRLAEADRDDATATLESLTVGEKALDAEEARTNLRLVERKVERLRQEYDSLKPLLDKGFITREELDRSAMDLEQAQAETELARKRVSLLLERTKPREEKRAQLLVSQRDAQVEQARQKQVDTATVVRALEAAIEASRIYARRPGLVVYEEYMAASPRRKVRVGDRVTASQGLITIPEVDRMLVHTSVREADVHRLKSGQPARIHVDAFPNLQLTGKVASIGALARASADRPFDDKRFEVIVDVDRSDPQLRPEMSARVEVLTGERVNVLSIPLAAVFERDGATVVYLPGRWRTQARAVELGPSNDFDVEVVTGLAEGERVKLDRSGGDGRAVAFITGSAPDTGVALSHNTTVRRDPRHMAAITADALTRYPLRTALSVLGIVLGGAAVIAVLSVSQGGRDETLRQVESLGLDTIVVRHRPLPPDESRGLFGLTAGDAGRIARLDPLVPFVTPVVHRYLSIESAARDRMAVVVAATKAFGQVLDLQLARGRFLNTLDSDPTMRVCVLGDALARSLFGVRDPLGEPLKIGGTWYRVVGILSARPTERRQGGALAAPDLNHAAIVSLAAQQSVFLEANPWLRVDEIWLRVSDGPLVSEAGRLVHRVLAAPRNGRSDYDVIVARELLNQRLRTQRTFNIIVGTVAFVALLVGGIGIMNIMLASVLERTPEIGLRRTVGATRRDIAVQFLAESLTMALAGGAVGVVAGIGSAIAISAYADWATRVSPLGILLAMTLCTGVGLVAGSYPAMRAARLSRLMP